MHPQTMLKAALQLLTRDVLTIPPPTWSQREFPMCDIIYVLILLDFTVWFVF